MPKILNFGSLCIDNTYKVDHFVTAGETITSHGLEINCGGKGLNQSIAAARASREVYHAGKIGYDGGDLRELLNKSGVDTTYLIEENCRNGQAIIQLDPSGQNCIFLYPGSNHMITEAQIDETLSHFEEKDILMLQNEINLIPYIIEKAHARGMQIVFNPSPITDALFSYPLEKINLFILNEVEGKALSDGESEPFEICRAIRTKYPASDVLLTLGSFGSVYFDGEKFTRCGIFKSPVTDTTAAGDTMAGFFVSAVAGGMLCADALRVAAAASAIAVSKMGASPSIPTLGEVTACEFEYFEPDLKNFKI